MRVGKLRAAVEAEVHMGAVSYDVAKSVLQRFAGEGEADRDGVAFDQGLNGVRRLLENDLAQRQSQIDEVWIVGSEVAEQQAIWWAGVTQASNSLNTTK